MKTYPSIDREPQNVPVYAFDKLDGSQIRAEWTRKKGLWKFGARGRLVGPDDKLLGRAEQLVREKYADDLNRLCRKQRWTRAVAFFEYYGSRSFAGWHHLDDDDHTVTLFDVAEDKYGLLEPREFLRVFGDLDIAPLLYHGNANSLFIAEVQEGRLEGMTFEGVVCKAKSHSPGRPLMFKLKNRAWIEKLKAKCGDNTSLFNELL